MFNHDSSASQNTISLLFSLRQRAMFRFREWCLAVFMKFCQAPVACICQNAKVVGKVTAIFLEQLKVVFAAMT